MNGTTFYTNFHSSIKTITKTDRCTSVNWGDIWFDLRISMVITLQFDMIKKKIENENFTFRPQRRPSSD